MSFDQSFRRRLASGFSRVNPYLFIFDICTMCFFHNFLIFDRKKLGATSNPWQTRDLGDKTLDFVIKTQGLGLETLGLSKTLGLPKPVANPWQTHDLPVATHDKNHGFGPSRGNKKNVVFLGIFHDFWVTGLDRLRFFWDEKFFPQMSRQFVIWKSVPPCLTATR